MSGFETRNSGFDDLFWPQVVRGVSVALCILPVTRFALGLLPLDRVGDASGLYNLARNLGGAIGIALIDTVIFTRSAEHAARLTDLLTADPAAAATILGIGSDELLTRKMPLGLMGIMGYAAGGKPHARHQRGLANARGDHQRALLLLWRLGPIRAR